jgi:hypothetical protein
MSGAMMSADAMPADAMSADAPVASGFEDMSGVPMSGFRSL